MLEENKYEMTRMEHVEHNTAIGWNVMNEDGIEGFSSFFRVFRR